jgi:hypothetical protein
MFSSHLRIRLLPVFLCVLALAACGEMAHEEYVRRLTEAHDTLTARQQRLESRFALGRYRRFDYDQGVALLVFSDGDTAKVVADIQFVGDVSRQDSTWLWSWANPTVEAHLRKSASRARRYGWRYGIWRLKRAHWPADQVDGWEMTSLTAWITNADGAYRAPDSDSSGYTFLLLRNVRRVPAGTPVGALLPDRSPARP